jgi:hypothetical protein
MNPGAAENSTNFGLDLQGIPDEENATGLTCMSRKSLLAFFFWNRSKNRLILIEE